MFVPGPPLFDVAIARRVFASRTAVNGSPVCNAGTCMEESSHFASINVNTMRSCYEESGRHHECRPI